MYVHPNFKTKKALKEAVQAGKTVRICQPGPWGKEPTDKNGVAVEGPWAPEPHTWYAQVNLIDGKVVKVK